MLFDLQIFSGGVYPPSATSRTISFSISNSFLVLMIEYNGSGKKLVAFEELHGGQSS